jgi:UDP-N-acetyl-D-mannosaminouronate:lipid I N-acetyl-D-mannosaminouronosyltransferase
MKIQPVSVNNVNIYPFDTKDTLLDFIDQYGGILVAVNAEKILHATDSTRQIINRNVGYCDGIGAVWALSKHGRKVKKIPGVELWISIIEKYHLNKSIYLIGGKEDVINKVVLKLQREFNQINIVGFRNGYILSVKEKEALIKDIQHKQPEIVFVAMGSPKQEYLMQEMQKVNKNAIYQGLGGSFDVYTGAVKRAPEIWIKYGLEWAYRWIKEPRIRTIRNLQLIRFFFKLKTNQF